MPPRPPSGREPHAAHEQHGENGRRAEGHAREHDLQRRELAVGNLDE